MLGSQGVGQDWTEWLNWIDSVSLENGVHRVWSLNLRWCVKFEITSDCMNMTEKEYHQEKKKDKYVGGKEGNQLIAYGTRISVMDIITHKNSDQSTIWKP